MKTLEITSSVEVGSLPRLLRHFRGVRSMLTLVESGDAIVGATRESLATRKQLREDVENVSAEIAALPDGQRHLLRAMEACPKCDGRGHQPSYDLEPPKCPHCRGTGYRFSAPNTTAGPFPAARAASKTAPSENARHGRNTRGGHAGPARGRNAFCSGSTRICSAYAAESSKKGGTP